MLTKPTKPNDTWKKLGLDLIAVGIPWRSLAGRRLITCTDADFDALFKRAKKLRGK